MKPSLFIATICLLANTFSTAQDRNVYWGHGLGGDANAWNTIRQLFNQERQMNGLSSTYVSTQGVATARNDVVSDMGALFGDGSTHPHNIGIGHSMGGVVLRDIDRVLTGGNQRYGGIITVGSPNQGAFIVNSLQNGDVDNAYDDACRRLLAGPASELPFVPPFFGGVVSTAICDILFDETIEEMLDGNLHQSAIDLAVGSDVLNNLGAGNVPKLSVWGDELRPVHWRLLSSIASDNQNDTEWVNRANSFRSFYNGMHKARLATSVVSAIIGFLNPWGFVAAADHAYKSIQWNRGKNWFDQSETIWNGLIGCKDGSVVTEAITYTEYYDPSDCEDFLGPMGESTDYWLDCLKHCSADNICMEEITIYVTVQVTSASDGFICNTSQKMSGLSSGDIYRAEGVNHQEELIHGEMIAQLRSIWTMRGAQDFFTTDER